MIWKLYRHYKREKGLSLLEILISISVLSVVLISFAMIFPSGFKLSKRSRKESKAALYAQSIVNKIEGMPFLGGTSEEEEDEGDSGEVAVKAESSPTPNSNPYLTIEMLHKCPSILDTYGDIFQKLIPDQTDFYLPDKDAQGNNIEPIKVTIIDYKDPGAMPPPGAFDNTLARIEVIIGWDEYMVGQGQTPKIIKKTLKVTSYKSNFYNK